MPDSADGHARLDEQTASQVRASLERVLASEVFRAAPQLSAFLSFIVERAVEGRRAELKGYTIAVEALGRPPEFDPQSDPIVRVEAGRLRRALTQYYAGEGRDDPLRIAIPVGAYVPVFLGAEDDGLQPAEDVAPLRPAPVPEARGPFGPERWQVPVLLVLCLTLAALLVSHLYFESGLRETPGSSAPAVNELPSVVVVAQPPPQAGAELTDRLRRASSALVDAMSRFDDLVVVKTLPEGAPLTPETADYVLELSMRLLDDTLEGFGLLRATKDGRVVWVSSTRRAVGEGLQDLDLSARMQRLAARLAEPFGAIHSDGRQNPATPAANCLYRALDHQLAADWELREPAELCLRRLIARDPKFYPAYAHLTTLLVADHTSGRHADSKAILDEALSAALAAQRLSPFSGRAQEAVANALFFRGAQAEALRLGRSALAMNPADPQILASLGSLYIRMNELKEGGALIERAIGLSPGRPAWYVFYGYLAAYLTDDDSKRSAHFAMLATETGSHGLLAQALEAARHGDLPRRDEKVRQLAQKLPLFRRDPKSLFAAKSFAPELTKRLLDDLGIVGP